MSSSPPEVPEEVDVVDAIAPPSKLYIRYSTETNANNHRWGHVCFDVSAITPGDIGGLYAALSSAIATDLQRLQHERKLVSKRASSFGMGLTAPGSETKYDPLNCELRIEHCRLLDKSGKLVLPPLGKANVLAVAGKEGWERAGGKSGRMDLVEWLLSIVVIKASSEGEGAVMWGAEVLQGLLFEEGVNWPWYCIKVGFVFGMYLCPSTTRGDAILILCLLVSRVTFRLSPEASRPPRRSRNRSTNVLPHPSPSPNSITTSPCGPGERCQAHCYNTSVWERR